MISQKTFPSTPRVEVISQKTLSFQTHGIEKTTERASTSGEKTRQPSSSRAETRIVKRTVRDHNSPSVEISIDSTDTVDRFLAGEIIFKVISRVISSTGGLIDSEYGLANDYDSYNKKLHDHRYNPLLYSVPIHLRLAYLYDTLNREYATKRNETFIFMSRVVLQKDWKVWFTVYPYSEK